MEERDSLIRSLMSLILVVPILILMPIAMNILTSGTTKTQEAVSEIESMLAENSTSLGESSVTYETIVSENLFESNESNSSVTSLVETMFPIIRIITTLLVVTMVISVTVKFIQYATYGSYGSSYSSYSYNNDSTIIYNTFTEFLNLRKTNKITDKFIYSTLLKSNKFVDKENTKFLQDCIEVKTEWYSFKKDIKDVDPNKKLFSYLLLDVLGNIKDITEYFVEDENKCKDIEDTHKESFEKYINNEDNYFKIKDNYYLKEFVFYVLTNNTINVKDLYSFISQEKERADISCCIANFVEAELSLEEDCSHTNTLEEAVKLFNVNYELNISIGMAQNLIYLSKIENNKNLQTELINTSILNEMKQYKHHLYK